MSAKALHLAGVVVGASMLLAGCPTSGGGSTDGGSVGGSKAVSGTWSGTLSCNSTQSINGSPGSSKTTNLTFTITFDSDGQLSGLAVLGYLEEASQTANVVSPGDTVTLTESTTGGATRTLIVTVRTVTITSTSAKVTLDLQYHAALGNGTTSGTGVQTIDASVNGATMTIQVNTTYNQTLSNPNIPQPIQVSETKACTGTLTNQ